MVTVTSLVLISIPVWVVWYWINLPTHITQLQAQYPDSLFAMEYISPTRWGLATLISLSSSGVLIFALWQLRSLFSAFQQGVVFSYETTRRLHRFGFALLICAILRPITTGLLSVVLSWGNPPGNRTLIFELGSNEIALMLGAATFLIITWIFREGQRLTQENAEFI